MPFCHVWLGSNLRRTGGNGASEGAAVKELISRLEHLLKTGLDGSHSNSPACCSSPPQNQQSLDHLRTSNASAIDSENLDTGSRPFVNDLELQHHDSEQTQKSVQRYYLCDYWYEGERWCIEIPASSWEDAQKRLRSLSQGKVVGQIEAVIPGRLGFLAKLIVWLKNF